MFRLRGPLYAGGILVLEAWRESSRESLVAAYAAACESQGIEPGDIISELEARGAIEEAGSAKEEGSTSSEEGDEASQG